MKKGNTKKAITAISLFILLIIVIIAFYPCISVLSIASRKNPQKRIYSCAAYNYGFCISYTHSVNKGRVHDYYKHDGKGNLVLLKSHFVSYGAGMPELEETEGASFSVLDNGYILKDINRIVPKLTMAVGVIANHTFSASHCNKEILGEPLDEIPLTDYFAPQTSLIFQYKKINRLEYFFHRIKGDTYLNKIKE